MKVAEIEHNIEHEQKLIDLLGYNLVGPDNYNRWIITDENDIQVGYIQYKKMHNKNIKRGYPTTYGYYTVIESSKISYEDTRKVSNVESIADIYEKFSYSFKLKNEDGEVFAVRLCMNELPILNISNRKVGFIEFKVSPDGLYLNFQSQTEKFNIEEFIIFKNSSESDLAYEKEYVYQIRNCNKKRKLLDENLTGTVIREISGSWNEFYQEPNKLQLVTKTWVHGNLILCRENEVEGTVEEMVIKHEMGLDAFNHFRFLINQILPFKQEVLSSMLSDEVVEKYGLSVFVPDLVKEKAPSLIKKNEEEKKDNA